MRMRRFPNTGKYMLVVAAGLLLAGCCRSNKISISQDVDMTIPIAMGVHSTNTKGKIDNLNNLVSECYAAGQDGARLPDKGFGVYSYKTIAGITKYPPLFYNTPVYPEPETRPSSTNSIDWEYKPLRYWDLTASYQFLAYWPYLPDGASVVNAEEDPYVSVPVPVNADAVTEDERALIIHNVPYWQTAEEGMDVMTSVRVGSYRSISDADGTDFSERDEVGFMFRHVLSNLVIKAYYINGTPNKVGFSTPEDDTDDGVYITGITLTKSGDTNDDVPGKNRLNWKADFTHPYTEKRATTGTLEYTDLYPLLTGANEEVEFKNEWEEEDDPDFEPSTIGSWLVVPHKWNGIKIGVNYTVGGVAKNSLDNPVPTTLGVESEDYMLQPGKTYTLTLLFDVSNGSITVQKIGVSNWTDYDATHYVYNW